MKNTIIVYTSDQGFYLGEHGWYDKRFVYDESFKTPLMVSWPEKSKLEPDPMLWFKIWILRKLSSKQPEFLLLPICRAKA